MAKILLIDGEGAKLIDRAKFTEEGKLQDYLEKYPTLIPLSEITEGAPDLLCIGREVTAGPGFVDLLFIDKDGLLTIVETKLAKNPEARREVIGQVVEYAAYISQWTPDDVHEIADQYLKSDKVPDNYRGKTFYEVVEQLSPEGGFSKDDFRSSIEQNLKNGRIRLIIGVDELIEPLRAMVTFLNSYSNFDMLLLQVSSFEESEAKKVLIPTLFGYTAQLAERGAQKRLWNPKTFFEDARKRCESHVVDTLMKLYEFTKSKANTISWGSGKTYGTFTFRKLSNEAQISIFTVESVGRVYLSLPNIKEKAKRETYSAFVSRLNSIPGVDISEEDKFPHVAPAILASENLNRFEEAVSALCQRLESEK